MQTIVGMLLKATQAICQSGIVKIDYQLKEKTYEP
jgi:hypothetical protein